MKWQDYVRRNCTIKNPYGMSVRCHGAASVEKIVAFLEAEGLPVLQGGSFQEVFGFINANWRIMEYMRSGSCFAEARKSRGAAIAVIRRVSGLGVGFIAEQFGKYANYYKADLAYAEASHMDFITGLITEFYDTKGRKGFANLSQEGEAGKAA